MTVTVNGVAPTPTQKQDFRDVFEIPSDTELSAAIVSERSASATLSNKTLENPVYTGTLTGGTGVVNLGSGQFVKDASGNVGVGTASPVGNLDVYKADQATAYVRTANHTLRLRADDATGVVDIGNPASTPITFTIGATEVARFSAGNLGIGTASPISGAGLTIGNDGNGGAIVKQSFSTATTERAFTSMHGGTGEMRHSAGFSGYGGFHTFYTNGAEVGRIDSAGNFGIGTASPTSLANRKVISAVASWGGVFESSNAGLSWSRFGIDNFNTGLGCRIESSGGIVLYPAPDTLGAVLTSAGNFGIGTLSPTYKIDTRGPAGTGWQIYEESTGTNKRLIVTQEATTVRYNATYSTAGNAHTWANGGTDNMMLDVAGNLGIGTSSPAAKLDVVAAGAGGGATQAVAQIKSASDAANNAVEMLLTPLISGQTRTAIGARREGATANAALYFATNNQDRVTIDASGNVGVGVVPQARLDVRATANAGGGRSSATGSFTTTDQVAGIHLRQESAVSVNTRNWALYTNASAYGTLEFGVSSARYLDDYATKITLDPAGNFGLGVTPSAWDAGYKAIQLAGSYSTALMGAGNQTELTTNAYFGSGAWRYVGSSVAASRYGQEGGSHKWYTAPSGTAGNPISFTQAMTLDGSGNLLVGTTSAGGHGFTLYPAGSSGGPLVVWNRPSTASPTTALDFRDNGTSSGAITYTNTATTYATSSDARLKENIAAADNGSALIDQLQVRKFDWKADGSHQRYGFVAQELDAVFPEAVSKSADPQQMMGVDYSKLVPLLVQEVQSLRARLAILEAKQ